MRRKDREISDRNAINEIIRRCKVCRIALCENGQPYILPLNFGYDGEYLYFHSANVGKKIEIIKQNNRVGFEFDILHEIITAENPCEWGTKYESVVGTGIAEFIESQQEKAKALECILSQYGGVVKEFTDPSLSSVTIIRVTIVSISGKEKNKGKKVSEFDKYVQMAKDLKMIDARIIGPDKIFFDIRAVMKCRWGCEDFFNQTIKCSTRNTSFQERVEMIKAYQTILLVHSHDTRELSQALLEIEKASFLDGHYFSFAVRYCKLCKVCAVDQGEACPTPEKVRPCDQSFGIDVYKTARNQGLPCDVLQNKKDVQNRYGFVLIA